MTSNDKGTKRDAAYDPKRFKENDEGSQIRYATRDHSQTTSLEEWSQIQDRRTKSPGISRHSQQEVQKGDLRPRVFLAPSSRLFGCDDSPWE